MLGDTWNSSSPIGMCRQRLAVRYDNATSSCQGHGSDDRLSGTLAVFRTPANLRQWGSVGWRGVDKPRHLTHRRCLCLPFTGRGRSRRPPRPCSHFSPHWLSAHFGEAAPRGYLPLTLESLASARVLSSAGLAPTIKLHLLLPSRSIPIRNLTYLLPARLHTPYSSALFTISRLSFSTTSTLSALDSHSFTW